jgi:diacylglycerol kinase (ATP)
VGYLINRLKAFGFAFNGIGLFFKEGAHAKVHLLAVLVVSILGWQVGISPMEWCLLILCYGLVISMEAMNSAIEHTVDLAEPNQHPLAKKAKDIAAAAVLMSALAALLIGLIIFVPIF